MKNLTDDGLTRNQKCFNELSYSLCQQDDMKAVEMATGNRSFNTLVPSSNLIQPWNYYSIIQINHE